MAKVLIWMCTSVNQADGFEPLVTALYPSDDKYLYSDTVFGVKSSLVVVSDKGQAVKGKRYGELTSTPIGRSHD